MSTNIAFRQWNQGQRIQNGIQSGQLTRDEAQELRDEQRGIRQLVQTARADGQVDAGERKFIRTVQDQASRDIYELKHNDYRAPGCTDNGNPGPFLPPQTNELPKIPGLGSPGRVDAREARQELRIERGIQRGDLTADEAAQLTQQQAQIHQLEALYKADGGLSMQDRLKLEALQDQASHAIFFARHNNMRP
jgi:hypothetical protein